jgi:hypothetical protein
MLKKLLVAGVAVGMMALNAPIVHAAVILAGCGYYTDSQEWVTGGQDTSTGVAYGYAVFSDQDTHTLRCYFTVDGSEVASTPTGSGSVFVITQATVTYTTVSTDVDLCTEIDGVTTSCGDATLTEIPPQAVIDALDSLFATLDSILIPLEEQLDPTICTVLKALAPGIPGVVDITADGDTTLVGVGPFYDCPPYGDLFPPA